MVRGAARPSPLRTIQGAVLDGFEEVFAGDGLGAGEVGDGAGDAEDAGVGAGGEAEFVHGGTEDGLRGGLEGAEALELAGGEVGVAADAGEVGVAFGLEGAAGEDACADVGGAFAGGLLGEVFEGDGGDLDVEIDAVEEGAGDAGAVAVDLGRRSRRGRGSWPPRA